MIRIDSDSVSEYYIESDIQISVQFLGFIIVDFVIIVFVGAVAFSNTDIDSNTAIISVFEWRFMLPIPFLAEQSILLLLLLLLIQPNLRLLKLVQ